MLTNLNVLCVFWQSLTGWPLWFMQLKMIAKWLLVARSRWPQRIRFAEMRDSEGWAPQRRSSFRLTCTSAMCKTKRREPFWRKQPRSLTSVSWTKLAKISPRGAGLSRKTKEKRMWLFDRYCGLDINFTTRLKAISLGPSTSEMVLKMLSCTLLSSELNKNTLVKIRSCGEKNERNDTKCQ